MKNTRDFKLNLNIFLNFGLKAINIGVNLAFVPLLIAFLGKEKYGIWLTIYAFVSWLQMFDLGLGNGFKLKLTDAFSNKKVHQIRSYISTSYIFISIISLTVIILFLFSNLLTNWDQLAGFSETFNKEYNYSFNIVIISFLVILIVKLVGVIYSSLQQPYIDNLIKTISQLLFLGIIFLLYYLNSKNSLIWVGLASTLPLILIYISFSIKFFVLKAPNLIPKISHFSKVALSEIAIPGINFFLIQICMVVLYSTDNLIILKLLSAEDVTNYNIAYKYFGLPFMIFTLYISTHWPAFIDALAKNEYEWISKKIYRFHVLFIFLIISYVIFYFAFNFIVSIWIGDENVYLENQLNLSMIIYYLISAYTTIYIYVVNAYGKLRVQLIGYLIIALINIPLSVILVKYFEIGISGVIIASAICLSILLILMPIQYSKIIHSKTKGVWNK
jgi:O-antigen/teichoic acid export membrane protein